MEELCLDLAEIHLQRIWTSYWIEVDKSLKVLDVESAILLVHKDDQTLQ